MADAFAVTQGLKKVKLELANSVPVDPNAVFDQLENIVPILMNLKSKRLKGKQAK